MKFAIWILIVLGALSLAAMFIGEFYDPRRGVDSPLLRWLVAFFELERAFDSWWYRLLLGILCLSLFACVWKRTPVVWRIWTSPPPDVSHMKSNRRAILRTTSLPRESLLKTLGGAWRFRTKSDAVWTGERGRIGMWGPLLTHLGMLLLGIGALATSFGGFTTRAGGYAGDVVEVPGIPFTVRVDSFRVTYYPLQPLQIVLVDDMWLGELIEETEEGVWMVRGWRAEGGEELVEVASDRLRNQFDYDRDRGNIKKFASFVTVIEDGEEVERREIAVNDPLRRAGFRLYQSSYDAKDPRFVGRYDSAFVLVMDSTGSAVQVLNLEPGEPSKVAGDSLSVVAGRLLPDFKIGSGFRPFSGSDQFINPGLELSFAGPNGYRKSEWVLLGLPSRERIGEFQYELKGLAGEDVQMEMMTIFEIKYTFGTSILWAGFLVGTLGLLLSFYMTHRVIYLVWPTPETPHTQVIAASRKIPLQFEKELDRVLGKG